MENTPTVIIAPEDRRDALRQPTQDLVFVVEHEECGSHESILMDVSRTGVRFRSNFCFPCGSTVILHPPFGMDLPEAWVRIMRQSTIEIGGETFFEYGVRYAEQAGTTRHNWFLNLRQRAA